MCLMGILDKSEGTKSKHNISWVVYKYFLSHMQLHILQDYLALYIINLYDQLSETLSS